MIFPARSGKLPTGSKISSPSSIRSSKGSPSSLGIPESIGCFMKTEDLISLFQSEKFDREFLKFENVRYKLSSRPDLHAFLVLDALVPGIRDMVSGAEHDEIYLDVEIEDLAAVVDPEMLLDLHRCGVRYDEETVGLAMFA